MKMSRVSIQEEKSFKRRSRELIHRIFNKLFSYVKKNITFFSCVSSVNSKVIEFVVVRFLLLDCERSMNCSFMTALCHLQFFSAQAQHVVVVVIREMLQLNVVRFGY